MAEGQKGGEVKPQGRGQRERGAGPGAAAAVERHTTSGPEGKKWRNPCRKLNTASGRPIQKRRWGYRDIYVLFEDPANKTCLYAAWILT